MGLLSSLKTFLASSTKVDVAARFEVLREAISGTMSSFYMARDRQTGKVVGLKILDTDKTLALEARFKGLAKPKEGEIAVGLKHPHIVETYEHGTTTKGEQYIVMEFLEGPGLNSSIVSKNPQLVGKRLNLIRQAAAALGAVHEVGYIHRDICPRNFVVSRTFDSLTLIDFGLTVPATPPFMQAGIRTGTPNYMAPEVVRRRPTSHKLDIFAFGVTCYELMAFDLPWPRSTTGQAAQAAMTHGIDEPGDIRQLCPNISPRLAAAIVSCIQPEPKDRPASMQAFLRAIDGVQSELG